MKDTGVITTTYNFEVKDVNTYYVSAAMVLVHNCFVNPKTIDYRKHVPHKGLTREEIVDSTKNGPAKYFLKGSKEVQKFELEAWKIGQPTTNGKPWKVSEFSEDIGAYDGKPVRWLRLEYSKGGDFIHGHPIFYEQYRIFLK